MVLNQRQRGPQNRDDFGGFGGGVFNGTGTLTLEWCRVSGNSAGRGAGISADALTMTNCLVTENKAISEGGGIYNRGAMTICNSVVSNNVSVFNGGGVFNLGTATVSDSSVVNNSGTNTGAGIFNGLNATLALNNTTVRNNADAFSGGVVGNLGMWQAQLEANKQAYFDEFVTRPALLVKAFISSAEYRQRFGQ